MWAFQQFAILVLLLFSSYDFLVSQETQQLTGRVYATSNNPNGLDTYSDDEFSSILILRRRVAKSLTYAYMFENAYLVRFLKQAGNNVDIAEELIQKHLDWRKSQQIDQFTGKNFNNWFHRVPHYVNLDREGRPGFISSLRSIDMRRFILSGEKKEFSNFLATTLEYVYQNLPNIINGTDREIYSVNSLYNAAGFDIKTHMCLACFPFWLELLNLLQNQYAYLFKRIIFVNVPRVAERLVAYLKPFMTPSMSESLQLYGVDRTGWNEIFKIYPKDQLPFEVGGTAPKPTARSFWMNAEATNYSKELQEKITPANLL